VLYWGSRSASEANKLLEDHVSFRGKVVKIKTSANHAFGIISLALDSSSIRQFDRSSAVGLYPYAIKNKQAELYTSIPDGLTTGDIVSVNSDQKKEAYQYVKSDQKFEGELQMVTADPNIDFVKKNSELK
jgi:hypothetical protein